MRSETASSSQCQSVIDGETSRSGKTRPESPLDFSTRKKFKPERLVIESKSEPEGESDTDTDNPESPCSRLRNILSMKSPLLPEDMAGKVLNLSKEAPLSPLWCKSDYQHQMRSSGSSNGHSQSNSPLLREHHATSAFVQSTSPHSTPIPIAIGSSTPTLVIPPVMGMRVNGSVGGGSSGSSNETTSSIGLPSWGSGVYSPSISPILNQTVPANGSLPLSFETSPTLFPHHIAAGGASPAVAVPFSASLSLPLTTNPPPGSKGRVTRPFKAYPKDPLSFSSVGLYGLPLGTAPGTTEAVIHQQSNQAYAEFRKQMLTSTQFGKCRRGAPHRNSSPYLGMDSMDEHISDNGSILRSSDNGSISDDGGSLINGIGKSKLGKSEQQMKDEAYWERRRKNNEAAKRSRDARRAKEDEIAIRAAFLEQENLKLRFEVCALKSETAKLRCMLYSG